MLVTLAGKLALRRTAAGEALLHRDLHLGREAREQFFAVQADCRGRPAFASRNHARLEPEGSLRALQKVDIQPIEVGLRRDHGLPAAVIRVVARVLKRHTCRNEARNQHVVIVKERRSPTSPDDLRALFHQGHPRHESRYLPPVCEV